MLQVRVLSGARKGNKMILLQLWTMLCVYMFIRTFIVYKAKDKILHQVAEIGRRRIGTNEDCMEPFEWLEAISFHEMMLDIFKFKWTLSEFIMKYRCKKNGGEEKEISVNRST